MTTTREQIREFHRCFGAPVESLLVESPSLESRILRAKLLLEEVVETITLGLGLKVYVDAWPKGSALDESGALPCDIDIVDVGAEVDLIELADGLGDVNVIIHGTAHTFGMNLDRVTTEIHRSNMSKLAEDGTAIINGVTHGYRDIGGNHSVEPGFDPAQPVGKILKGPDYEAPDLGPILAAGNW